MSIVKASPESASLHLRRPRVVTTSSLREPSVLRLSAASAIFIAQIRAYFGSIFILTLNAVFHLESSVSKSNCDLESQSLDCCGSSPIGHVPELKTSLANMIGATDLPEDLLTIIFSFLDAKSFLRFCRTCRDLYQYRQDPAYWRNITSASFRLPISPLLKADGARWYWLYKRLRTQTKLYTWGKGVKGNLGPGRILRPRIGLWGARGGRGPRPFVNQQSFQRTSSSWPTEVHVPDEVGVIADLQCGGWSTSILSSAGNLYTVGLINAADHIEVGDSASQFERLQYLTQSTSAIQQFSSGRSHILALTDDGEILSWDRINAKGLRIFSQSGQNFGGRAVRVVAGWAESSAYIPEAGIIYWAPITNDQQDQMLDGLHVKERVIPDTARKALENNQLFEVATYIVLECWIVWLTTHGKLYACELRVNDADQRDEPFEVPGYRSSARVLKDVQGQFRNFAVFTENGEVLAGNTDYIRHCARKARSLASIDNGGRLPPPEEWPDLEELVRSRPPDKPALQHSQVISLAFGDHHCHALHLNGKITSYGTDSESCGTLGLGDAPSGSRFRGLQTFNGWRADSRLIPQAEERGREIWFEPEKRAWLEYMEERITSGDYDPPPNENGFVVSAATLWMPSSQKQFMFSEWVEQEGRHWTEGPVNQGIATGISRTTISEHDFHLDPYFALAVSALGWHSGALVLVDEEKAEMTRQKWMTKMVDTDVHNDDEQGQQRVMPGHFEPEPSEPRKVYVWQRDGFPKVVLPDGFEMPGDGEPRAWREGRPTMSALGLVMDQE